MKKELDNPNAMPGIDKEEARKVFESTPPLSAVWTDAEVKILKKGLQKHRSCPRKLEKYLPGKTYRQIQNKVRMM